MTDTEDNVEIEVKEFKEEEVFKSQLLLMEQQ